MGNHRADRRGPGRRPSDLATPIVPASSVGKRRAEKPVKSARRSAVAPTPVSVEQHSADNPILPPQVSTAGIGRPSNASNDAIERGSALASSCS